MPNFADYLQRGIVLACVGASIYGVGIITQGHSARMAKARDAAAKMSIDPALLPPLPKKDVVQSGNPI